MMTEEVYSRVRKVNVTEEKKQAITRANPNRRLVNAYEVLKVGGVEFLTQQKEKQIIVDIRDTLKGAFQKGFEAQDIMLIEGEKPEIRVKGSWMTLEQCNPWELDHFNYFLFNQSRLSTKERNGKYYVGEEYIFEESGQLGKFSQFKYKNEPIDIRSPKYAKRIPILDTQFFHHLMQEQGNSYDYSLTLNDNILRCHVYSAYGVGTRQERVAFSIRIVPQEIPKLDTLNLPKRIEDITKHSKGLFLVSGGIGDGKSTTVASIINRFNQSQDKRRVITVVEDPIEYIHNPVNAKIIQRRLGDNVQSYERATTDSLRESSDIVVLGELQSAEEMSNALRLAEVGKLVIATIHANSVAHTVERFVWEFKGDQSQYRNRLLENLLGILHQNLVAYEGEQFPLSSMLLLENEEARKPLREKKFSREAISSIINDDNGKGWAISQRDWFDEQEQEAYDLMDKIANGEVSENFLAPYQKKLKLLLNENAREKILLENGIDTVADRVSATAE